MRLETSNREGKKYVAIFDDGTKTHFGQAGSSTYLDHKDKNKRDAYISRHRVNENWNDPKAAGTLARFLLWNKPTLSASLQDYKQRFGDKL